MEGMVNDLQLAREKHAGFNEWKTEQKRTLPYDMVVSVLTTGFWPTYKVCHSCPSDKLLHLHFRQLQILPCCPNWRKP